MMTNFAKSQGKALRSHQNFYEVVYKVEIWILLCGDFDKHAWGQ